MTNDLLALLALLGVLNILDVATTWEIIRLGGVELNPVMRWAMAKIGVLPAMIAGKLLFALGLWLLPREAVLSFWPLALCCAIYAAFVANNFLVINKLEQRAKGES